MHGLVMHRKVSLGKLVTKSNKSQQNQQKRRLFESFYCTTVILLAFVDFCVCVTEKELVRLGLKTAAILRLL